MYIRQLIIHRLKSSWLPENSLGMFIFFFPEDDSLDSVPRFMLFGDSGDDGGVGSGNRFSPMFKGEMGGEWIGVVNGMIASRLSGGGKKLLNGPNPGEKIELRAKSSGSCIDGELVLTELTRLFCSKFVLSFQESVT